MSYPGHDQNLQHPPAVVGVDPSLTATAVCGWYHDHPEVRVSKTKNEGSDHHSKLCRMARQVGFVDDWTSYAGLVLVEGPSFSSKGAATRDLAGLWWLLYRELDYSGARIAVVSPSELKLWATGKGNADKFQVGQAIARRWPQVELQSDDEADALVLCSMGLHRLGLLPWEPTAFQVKALDKVAWPLVEGREAP